MCRFTRSRDEHISSDNETYFFHDEDDVFFFCSYIIVNSISFDLFMLQEIDKDESTSQHQIPRSMIPRRVNPTCRSGCFRSDPHRISSESDIFHKKPIGSDRVFVGFRRGFRRNPTERNPTKTLSDPIEIISIRRDPIPPQSHGYLILFNHFVNMATMIHL
jgi:hypothetical protein